MGEYVLTLLATAVVTYLLTPAVRRLAVAVGAIHAARDRDVHVVPTPLLGGFAMYAGLAVGLLVASRMPALTGAFAEPNMAKGLLLAGGLVVIMGFIDDRWGLGALSKLAGQVAAGVILVWSGAEVTWVPLPGGTTLGLTSDQQTAATILVVVVTINAVNFIDGLDGLATGIVGIGAAAFFVYYYTLTHRLGLPDQTGPALASAVLAGICLGFLPHNFHPARIFMGDTGAMLIGLLLAYAPISSLAVLDPASLTDTAAYHAGTVNRFGAIVPLLLPAAILLIPYADLLMAVVRRTRAGTSPFSADKKHLHHRLLAIGHSHRASVLIMYLWAALFAGCVAWLSIVRTSLYVLIIVTGAAMLALALLLVSMPRLRPWARRAAAAKAAAAQPVTGTAPEEDTAEPRPAWAAAGPDPAIWQGARASAGDGAPSHAAAWAAAPNGAPSAPTAERPAAGNFSAAEIPGASGPADGEATRPIPAVPWSPPSASGRSAPPAPPSGSGATAAGSGTAEESAAPPGSGAESWFVRAASPAPPAGSGTASGAAVKEPPGPASGPGAESWFMRGAPSVPPASSGPGEPALPPAGSRSSAGSPPGSGAESWFAPAASPAPPAGSGPAAGESSAPPAGSRPAPGESAADLVEPAPWPGFAPEGEPSGSAPGAVSPRPFGSQPPAEPAAESGAGAPAAQPGGPATAESVTDRWSLPSFPSVDPRLPASDPRLPASLQDRR